MKTKNISLLFLLISFLILAKINSLERKTLSKSVGYEKTLKIMTFNIHYGNTIDNVYNIEEIGKVIKNSGAELICLQEVDKNWSKRSNFDNTIQILSSITGYYYYYSPIYIIEESKKKNGNYRYFGVGFLSKYKIIEQKNYNISRWSTQEGDPQPGDPDFPSKKGGFGHILIDVDGTYFSVYNTHLDYRAEPPEGYDKSIRVLQVQEMMQIMDTETYPTILTGDMNTDTTAKDVFDPMLEKFNDSWQLKGVGEGLTFPCTNPTIRIDYILTSKNTIFVKSAKTIESEVSDHLPVVIDVAFNA